MKPITNKVSQVIIAPRQKHSEKPNQIRDKIIELFGDLPRIELFARTRRDGWDSNGNQLNKEMQKKFVT
jgi:site-specific DNA-methyltransferase (adenine-specific)